ncbi:response regulator transcription factor [Acidisoma cellulosilytica]|uniref:Response regulator transcription factor n=1 Tax=Acidisoma cellulosilyticum TaxID=2802395 RepID=A0A963Z8E6_9PROT|nr:response regulator transcription factor [Acidisoma cellulosilyticum]MCB8883970.1 response regulator transcription factor [Acidisoma cellulosilyticum]
MIHIALIDGHKFTQECFISAAFSMQPLIALTPFSSVGDFAGSSMQSVDLVAYVHHDPTSVGLEDITAILRLIPPQRLIVISHSLFAENDPFLHQFETRLAAVIQARSSSLQKTLSTFFMVHYRSQSASYPKYDPLMTQKYSLPKQKSNSSVTGMFDLTTRERMVLDHIRQGQSNREIAEILNMSISTVKSHVHNIIVKTGTTSRIQIALLAERHVT